MALIQRLWDLFTEMLSTTEYAMSYNQGKFLVFLIVFFSVFFLVKFRPIRKVWILLGNIFFCMFSGWTGLVVVFGTAVIVYITSLFMELVYNKYEKDRAGVELKPKEQVAFLAKYKRKAKVFLWLALLLILGLWIYIKFGKFTGMPTVNSFREMFTGMGIIVPLGISYYTLSAVGYLADIYWRKTKPVHNLLDLLVVMTYFPHIVQGPISKYDKLLKQISNIPKFDYTRVCFGLQRMLWGYIKKMVIADRLIVYTDAVFGNLNSFAGVEVFLAVVFSGMQLYADFSGCMDIVIGISQVMGIELEENFRQPFFSKSASEFWTRWHMTLSAWTKAYIYLPIAMSPKFMKLVKSLRKHKHKWLSSFVNSFVPLVSVWIFTGLWHGTGTDYLLWGLYWCAMMTISNETSFIMKKVGKWLHIDETKNYFRYWQYIRTYAIFVIGKCFTAAGGLAGFVTIFSRMFAEHRFWVLFDESLFTHGLDRRDFYIAVIGIIVMLLIDLAHEKGAKIREAIAAIPLPIRWCIYIAAIVVVAVLAIYGPGFDASGFAYGEY